MKQMVVNLLIFLLIIGAIYVLTYPDSQFVSTASAIRHVWSGNCRLNCRQSQFSAFSGFSGLSGLVTGQEGKAVAHSSHAGPSSGCMCEACPCALIDSVLRTCRPAATMYSRAVDVATTGYYTVLETLNDVYSYMQRVFNCRASCQRPQVMII
ncbi:uncharacterized protein [Epargyreus clarus]|uniref:uncharacterized protein isoform X2 n=1 Tax=Epargyreus clarus TaxID=520877 RepID=UPI003C2D0B30